jgi:hypothetical protein
MMSRTIYFRLLAHAPEELQREVKENALGAIPALCFTEDDIRKKLAQEEQWDELSDDEQSTQLLAFHFSETVALLLQFFDVPMLTVYRRMR